MADRQLTLADGQLGTTAATLFSGANAPATGRINLIASNTGILEETIVLTFQRAGGTARRIARAVLKKNQALMVCGLPIQPDDTLLGVTTSATVVDYLISASEDSRHTITVLDVDGTPKQSATFEVEVSEKFGLTRDGIAIVAKLEDIHNVLLKIA